MKRKDQAQVILIEENFYSNHTKTVVETVDHLIGAKLFALDSPELKKTMAFLKGKKKDPIICRVDIFPF